MIASHFKDDLDVELLLRFTLNLENVHSVKLKVVHAL